ncbi:MAG: M12 family metallo-peptidase [Planctomycetota bacterium]|nr:M12 family metallo-peptidase [Planctomycetota bacterium]
MNPIRRSLSLLVISGAALGLCQVALAQQAATTSIKAATPGVAAYSWKAMSNIEALGLSNDSADGVWSEVKNVPQALKASDEWVRPAIYRVFAIDDQAFQNVVRNAPMEFTPEAEKAPVVFTVPMPDGSYQRFNIVENQIMEPGLAAQFPTFKTYQGVGIDDPSAIIRLSWTELGFAGQIQSPNGWAYIDPYSKGNTSVYSVYWKRDNVRGVGAFMCYTESPKLDIDVSKLPPASGTIGNSNASGDGAANGGGGYGPRALVSLQTYRLAVAATGEYTANFGGTQSGGQAAIVTMMNRINGVYEAEVAIRMTLVANNQNIVYTNAATDPFSTGAAGTSTMLNQNQSTIDSVIGSTNYDIGHNVSTGSGGVAQLGVVCTAGSKAKGSTGLTPPTGDSFWIDYVAHEMGHQWGGNHTFNGVNGSCAGGNRNASTAYEVGSGSTIQAYAGICGTNDNLQANSDAYFHFQSIAEISAHNASRSCKVTTVTTNNAPTITVPNYSTLTIPISTPFELAATGNDIDGHALTYCWEERDLGAAQAATPGTDNGTSPIFRSFTGTSTGKRLFPQLSAALTGATPGIGEKYPTTSRTLKWRCTVRDNRAGGGGTAFGDTQFNTTTTAGPFTVTSQTSPTTWTGLSTQTITWNVANTTASPVNCANVAILFSTDNGVTFPYTLVSSTPNDGSQTIIVPNVATNTGRIKVAAVGNIFLNFNRGAIRINAVTGPADPTGTTATPNPVCAGSNVTLSATVGAGETVDWFTGGCGTTLVGSGTSLVIPAPASPTTYFSRARNTTSGLTSTNCGSVTVGISALATDPTSVTLSRSSVCAGDTGTITLTAVGGSGTQVQWFSGGCGGAALGTGTSIVVAAPTSTTTYYARWTNSCGNSNCASNTVTVNPLPSAPTSASVDRADLCGNDTGTITLTATGGSGATLNWYTSSCGGTLVGSGSPLTIAAPTASTTYYARWSNACGDSSCQSVDVTVTTADFNGDGFIDFTDFDAFVAAFEAGDLAADFNRDGFIDFTDFDAFVASFEIGC